MPRLGVGAKAGGEGVFRRSGPPGFGLTLTLNSSPMTKHENLKASADAISSLYTSGRVTEAKRQLELEAIRGGQGRGLAVAVQILTDCPTYSLDLMSRWLQGFGALDTCRPELHRG